MTSSASTLVAPDSFKGCLTAPEVAAALARGLQLEYSGTIVQHPMSDGGDGAQECVQSALGGTLRGVLVHDPLGRPLDAHYLAVDSRLAAIEVAVASGLALVRGRNDPLQASTRGTGELIAAARAAGARHVMVMAGGSATTDGGLGAIEALGGSLRGMQVTVACDVRIPFLAAAETFAPQKGASPSEVKLLSRRLDQLADRYETDYSVDVRGLVGGGAAGGLAGGLAALGARLVDGFECIADITEFDDALANSALVVTGEGQLDRTSFDGKVVGEVLRRASHAGVRAVVVAARATDQGRRLASDLGAEVIALVGDGEPDCSHSDTIERLAAAAAQLARQ